MIKNLNEKAGIVAGAFVTNSIDSLRNAKGGVLLNLGVNLGIERNIPKALAKTAKHIAIATAVGGTWMTLLDAPEIAEVFKELDEETDLIRSLFSIEEEEV